MVMRNGMCVVLSKLSCTRRDHKILLLQPVTFCKGWYTQVSRSKGKHQNSPVKSAERLDCEPRNTKPNPNPNPKRPLHPASSNQPIVSPGCASMLADIRIVNWGKGHYHEKWYVCCLIKNYVTLTDQK